jgi:hypothetical protein
MVMPEKKGGHLHFLGNYLANAQADGLSQALLKDLLQHARCLNQGLIQQSSIVPEQSAILICTRKLLGFN